MKKLVILAILAAGLSGCQKDHGYQDKGTILGFDYRKCMCCGGWFIEIEQDTLRFDQVPEGCKVELENPVFPVKVYLDWHHKDPKCLGDEIVVTRMEVRK